jgi:Transposase zinc-binding domain
MSRPKLEVADVFRRHGAAWRAANKAHLSLAQRRVMTAIEVCRTAALGGHVERCEDCAHTRIAYNSCRNRHCPKCQWPAAQAWMAAREAELLPVPYFHVVFTLPAALGAITYQNKAKLYGLLFTAAAETLTTIAGDPKHLGADIGVLSCTLGARTSSTIRMCIASCRVADYRRTASAGSPVGTASFFRSACSRACFAACSCKLSKPCTPPTNCSSSPISASSNTPTRGELTSRRCATANGSSMPKSPSPVLSKS